MCSETNTCGNFIPYEYSVLQGVGWASLQNPPKGCFCNICKKLCEKMPWEWTEKLCSWTGWPSKVCSNPDHSDAIIVCKLVSCSLSSSQWAAHVSREKESYFNSSFSDALWRKLGSAGITFVRLGCCILFIHLLISSLIYLLSSRLRQNWRQFALVVFNHK